MVGVAAATVVTSGCDIRSDTVLSTEMTVSTEVVIGTAVAEITVVKVGAPGSRVKSDTICVDEYLLP